MVYARRLLLNILGFICLFLLLARPANSQTTKSNIVFILVDNVGGRLWRDLFETRMDTAFVFGPTFRG